jgi:hypothetical protein
MKKFFVIGLTLIWAMVASAFAAAPLSSPSLGDEGSEVVSQPPAHVLSLGRTSIGKQGFGGWEGQVFIWPSVNTTNTAWPQQRDAAIKAMVDHGLTFQSITGLANPSMVTLGPNGTGTNIRGAFFMESSTNNPFFASELEYEISSSDGQNALKFSGTFTGLSVARTGVGTDGSTYTSGNPPITSVYSAGVGNGFLAEDAAGVSQIQRFIDGNRPWSVTFRYAIPRTGLSIERTVWFNQNPPTLQISRNGTGNLIVTVLGGNPGTLDLRGSRTLRGDWAHVTWVELNTESQVLVIPPDDQKRGFFSGIWNPKQ